MTAPSSDQAAIRQIIRALRADGWVLLLVDNCEEEIRVRTEAEAIDAIMAVDAAYLIVAEGTPTGNRGWVFFVLGNDPEEVAADYTVNLTAVDNVTTSWLD